MRFAHIYPRCGTWHLPIWLPPNPSPHGVVHTHHPHTCMTYMNHIANAEPALHCSPRCTYMAAPVQIQSLQLDTTCRAATVAAIMCSGATTAVPQLIPACACAMCVLQTINAIQFTSVSKCQPCLTYAMQQFHS